LNIGDVVTAYALRGRVITMAQQLRLHRCPSAVLSSNGSIVSTKLQAERRILFWCIYSLDTFASLQLGVPRLLKDYEIECALPFSNDDENDANDTNFIIVNDSKISLVGKVMNFSLAIMRFSKIMGNILDNIFKRHKYGLNGNDYESIYELILVHENLLDTWRRNLPQNLKFKLDVNGLSTKQTNGGIDLKKKTLIMLYYSAKIIIHLPLIANDVDNDEGVKRYGSSNIAIQQCTIALLNNLSEFYSQDCYYIPIPINIFRFKIRLALLSAKGSLEYTRGGSLFQEAKTLLTQVVEELKGENLKFLNEKNNNDNGYIPGNVSIRCLKLLENAIESILTTSKPSSESGLKKSNSEKRKNSSAKPASLSNTSPISQDSLNSSSPSLANANSKSNDDELTQMLSQLDGVPPILPNDHINNKRIPSISSRQRSHSVKNDTSPPPPSSFGSNSIKTQQNRLFNNAFGENNVLHNGHVNNTTNNGNNNYNNNSNNAMEFNFNDIDLDLLNYNIPTSFNDVELDFGADGSLGLAPWLNDNNLNVINGSKNTHSNASPTPPLDTVKQEDEDEEMGASSLFDWQNSSK
jgi:transcriptional regulatory protein CAT8